jgi:hypothetical protein
MGQAHGDVRQCTVKLGSRTPARSQAVVSGRSVVAGEILAFAMLGSGRFQDCVEMHAWGAT